MSGLMAPPPPETKAPVVKMSNWRVRLRFRFQLRDPHKYLPDIKILLCRKCKNKPGEHRPCFSVECYCKCSNGMIES